MSTAPAPHFNFVIGDKYFKSNPPGHFQSFEYTRKGDAANEFAISLVYIPSAGEDPSSLERTIINSNRKVSFQYGWQGGPISPTINGIITGYSLRFVSQGIAISISGIGAAANEITRTRTMTFETCVPSEIVRELARIEGWAIGRIEATKAVYNDEMGQAPKVFYMSDMSSLYFIQNILIPDSMSLTGERDFSFSIEETKGQKKIYFQSLSSAGKGQANKIHYWNRTGDFTVLDFSMDFSGAVMLANANKTESITTVWLDENLQSFPTQSEAQASNDAIAQEAGRPPVKAVKNEETTTITSPEASTDIFEATLTTRGDPDPFQPLVTKLQVIPMIRAQQHHSGGIFIAKFVTDSIQGGTYTTTYNLIRQASSAKYNPSVLVSQFPAISMSAMGTNFFLPGGQVDPQANAPTTPDTSAPKTPVLPNPNAYVPTSPGNFNIYGLTNYPMIM